MAKGIGTHRTNSPPRIVECKCRANELGNTSAAQFQDLRYGPGMRVANPNTHGYVCTVCTKQFGMA